ncbi:hypothetical protein AN639_09310 [Candidatus Epulonipiscium fishelsonii]|uniref:Uncharacterized protein n=1 Tax=Candidatus Epulonipiscium fishelsonii TaxID=77094 RepID=A0ACC8XDW1_9FIRM|nr:hypothetical protein AN639_09310 [Epulopiscium sp. SCG-B05WGA-EpuloA1]ONI41040.1 hypothetical protein AN396_04595 [Epulopiscium sp. SCG-B11WGA-EpuloA1]
MLTPGIMLGQRYEILEKIGSGGMSFVYKAKCHKLRRFVAVKILKEELSRDEEFVRKFKAEALAAASLSHPNIVGVLDVGNDQGFNYFVMEYIEGKTLKELIYSEAPLSENQAINYIIQILSGLKHAHKKQIIHRDIKPQNILVTSDEILKVTDFGIARAMSSDGSTIIANNNAIGSVHYFSPEQARGGYVNETSDLYACGIVLFEMLTNNLPFEADSYISVALQHINEPIPKPSSFRNNINPELEQIILKVTNKKQDNRYQKASEMIADLQKLINTSHYNFINADTALETKILTNGENKMIQKNISKNRHSDDLPIIYKFLVALSGIVFAIALLTFGAFWIFVKNAAPPLPKLVTVPNIQGKTVAEASVLAAEKNLIVREVGQQESIDTESGTILAQTPRPNEVINENQLIEVITAIEREVELIELPDIVGMTSADAQRLLEKEGFIIKITRKSSNVIELGKVIKQTPKADTELEKGELITLEVSSGPDINFIEVPNLYGQTIQQAQTNLRNVGLTLGSTLESYSDTMEEGKIIAQGVQPERGVEKGSAIDVTVSLGKEVISIEDEIFNFNMDDLSQMEYEQDFIEGEEFFDIDYSMTDEPDILVTKPYNIMLPQELSNNNNKDAFHVIIMFQNIEEEITLFDKVLKKEQFPYPVNLTASGKGNLIVYFDAKAWWNDPFSF